MEPTQIGKYIIKKRIGKGGMGDVYLANDPVMNRDVALKLLNSERVNKPEQFKRFQNEAKMLTSLEHRAIVPVYDYGGINKNSDEEPIQPYLVMRYMAGGSVAGMLKRGDPIEVDHALNIVERISTALDFLHYRGFVHRDIKPANFLLDSDGAAYLADFGIAKFNDSGDTSLTRDGAAIGTYAYMSPEQIKSPKSIDLRADIYGLGIVLFELFTGKVPFIGDSIQMMYGHLDREVPRLSEFNENLPYGFDDIIQRALAKNPEHRYESAGELVDELKTASTEAVIDLDKVRRYGETEVENQLKAQAAVEAIPTTKTTADNVVDGKPASSFTEKIGKYWLAVLGGILGIGAVLFFVAQSGNFNQAEPTSTPQQLAPIVDPTETHTPTAVSTTPAPTDTPIFSADLRINGNTSTTFWRSGDSGIEELPANGILPLTLDEPVTIQVNANALLFNLPNGDRLFVDALSDVSLVLQNETSNIQIGSSTGGLILESFGKTLFTLDSGLEASVVEGRLGVQRTNDDETIELHCLVGECHITPTDEDEFMLAVGSSTAVNLTGNIIENGAANYDLFTNIIDSVLGALPTPTPTATNTPIPPPTATATREAINFEPAASNIGESVNGEPIRMVQFGNGPNVVIFVGGIHAGYAPNSVQVAESAITYFLSNPQEVPLDVTMYIIANLNPDSPNSVGQAAGRLNANGVDLNRNWDCKWTKDALVFGQLIAGSGGAEVHSEPETQALLSLIEEVDPKAVLVWGAGQRDIGVVAPGSCTDQTITSVPLAVYYGVAAQYDYPETMAVSPSPNLTGDLTNYLDDREIPAAFVIFPSFTELDFSRELAGIKSVLTAVNEGDRGINVTPTPEVCEEYDLDLWGERIDTIIIRPIGCALGSVMPQEGAFQQFQNGWMLWREDQSRVYVMYNENTRVESYSVNQSDAEEFEGDASLKGAFGYLYTNNTEVADALGTPIEPEQSTNNLQIQDFTNGMILTFTNDPGYFVVINTEVERWRRD